MKPTTWTVLMTGGGLAGGAMLSTTDRAYLYLAVLMACGLALVLYLAKKGC